MMGFQPRLIESCFTPTCPSTFPPLTGLTAYQASPLSKNYSAPAPSGNSNCLIVRRRFSLGDGFRSRQRKMSSILCLSALSPDLKTTLDKVVASQKVILFMKGTKEFPQCGFSHTVVQILMSLNVPFETVNILENDLLRQALKEYSSWPTFPQLYIDGEFFGGCDITVAAVNALKGCIDNLVAEAYKSGQLQELLEKALCS